MCRMAFPSSPHWKPREPGDEGGGWESSLWFEGASNTGQAAVHKPTNAAGRSMFHMDSIDVDGMFGPGAFDSAQ